MTDRCRMPGIDLDRSYGAADFVAFYDSHPDREKTWDLTGAHSVAVIGRRQRRARRGPDAGPHRRRAAVHRHPRARARRAEATPPSPTSTCSPAAARRRPSSPRSSCASSTTPPTCRCSSSPRAWSSTPRSQEALAKSKSLRMVVDVLSEWAIRDADPNFNRRIHIHFLENPLEMLGEDGKVVGLRTEHQELTGDGNVRGTGEFTDLERAGRLPGRRLPLRGHRGPAVRHPQLRAAQRRRSGARPGRRASCPASTPPAGSSAARSASSATPSPTPPRPSPTCSPMRRR